MAIFLGRQPILDRARQTYGYELLYRRRDDDSATFSDHELATSSVVERALLEWGLTTLVGTGRAFINVSGDFVKQGAHTILPPDRVVLELLEHVELDEPTTEAIRAAVDDGYTFALDDVVSTDVPGLTAMLSLVNVVKVDVMKVAGGELATLVDDLRSKAPRALLLAEKVETIEVYEACSSLGFDLFQGYYFAQPETLRRGARAASATAGLALLAALEDPLITIDRLAELVGVDPTLAYRLLTLVNSIALGVSNKIGSIHAAIVLLGIDRVRHFSSLLTLAASARANPELVTLAATRARMASELVDDPQLARSASTVGLLSVLDAVFHVPMEELIADLPLSDNVHDALVHGTGPLGEVLAILRAYEAADSCELERLRPGRLDDLRLAFGAAVSTADGLRRELHAAGAFSGDRRPAR
jgi:c-di-GMP phosphodiesterase